MIPWILHFKSLNSTDIFGTATLLDKGPPRTFLGRWGLYHFPKSLSMQWKNSHISWLYLCNLRRKNRRCVTAEKLMEQRRHGDQNCLLFPALGFSCQKGKFEQVVMITVTICRKGRSFFGELLGKSKKIV